MIFWRKWSKSFFSHKYWHLLFQNCIQYALRNFLRCITCLYVKNWRCWNSFHIRLIFEFPQPRGCFWRGYATQEADQELKWKLMTLSVWKIWVLAFLGPQSWYTRGDSTSKSPYGIGLIAIPRWRLNWTLFPWPCFGRMEHCTACTLAATTPMSVAFCAYEQPLILTESSCVWGHCAEHII